MANKTDSETVKAILALRRVRLTSGEIAEVVDRPLSTIRPVLKREGLGRLWRLDVETVGRYQLARPGELTHIDVKKVRPH